MPLAPNASGLGEKEGQRLRSLVGADPQEVANDIGRQYRDYSAF